MACRQKSRIMGPFLWIWWSMGERLSERCLLHMRLIGGSLLQLSCHIIEKASKLVSQPLLCPSLMWPLHSTESDFKVHQIMSHPCSKFFCVITRPLELSSECCIWPSGTVWSSCNTILGTLVTQLFQPMTKSVHGQHSTNLFCLRTFEYCAHSI